MRFAGRACPNASPECHRHDSLKAKQRCNVDRAGADGPARGDGGGRTPVPRRLRDEVRMTHRVRPTTSGLHSL
jgi:hypothetical protein